MAVLRTGIGCRAEYFTGTPRYHCHYHRHPNGELQLWTRGHAWRGLRWLARGGPSSSEHKYSVLNIYWNTHRHFGKVGSLLLRKRETRQGIAGPDVGNLSRGTLIIQCMGLTVAIAAEGVISTGLGIGDTAMSSTTSVETGVHAALALAETVLVVSGLRFHPDAATDGEVIVFFEDREAAAGVGAVEVQAVGGRGEGFVVELGLYGVVSCIQALLCLCLP